MSLTPYTKTIWAAGATPDVSATRLNALETGIASGQHLSGTYAQMTAALAIANPETVYMATDIGNAFFKSNGATWDPLGIPQLRSTLPGTPYEGQVIAFAPDWTNFPGVAFTLRYSPLKPDGSAEGSAYKWVSMGGGAMVVRVDATETTASTTYTNLATDGPKITTPLAGDWECDFGARAYTNNTAGVLAMMALFPTPVDADDCEIYGGAVAIASSMSRAIVKTGLASGTVIRVQYRASGAATVQFQTRYLRIRPIRLG